MFNRIYKLLFLATLTILLSSPVYSNTHWNVLKPGLEYTELNTNPLGGKLHAFKISPQKYQFKIDLAANHNEKYLSIKSFVKKNSALLGINGGFFSPDWQPLGLRKINNQNKYRFKNISWWGVAAFKNDTLKILSGKEYIRNPKYKNAIQCGPRLVINDNVPKLKPGIAERSAICTNHNNEILIIITNNHPISINKFAHILAQSETRNGLGCRNALNLDGGSSSQLYSQITNKRLFLPGLSGLTDALLILPKS